MVKGEEHNASNPNEDQLKTRKKKIRKVILNTKKLIEAKRNATHNANGRRGSFPSQNTITQCAELKGVPGMPHFYILTIAISWKS